MAALKSLGMNTMEQEVIDMTNTVARNGLIFFPEFCQIVLKRFREENEEEFAQVMFKVKSADIFNDLFSRVCWDYKSGSCSIRISCICLQRPKISFLEFN